MNDSKKTMRNGTGCGCGCVKSMIQSNINNSNHPDPFKAVNYNNNKKATHTKDKILRKELVKNKTNIRK